MAKIGGTQVNVGLGIEGTPGTPVSASIYPKWRELSLQAVSEKSLFNSARGIRNMASDSMIRRKYSEGSLSVVPNAEIAPYLLGMALGSVASSTDDPEAGANTHTITVQNANASMKAATVLLEHGSEVTERYSNVVCNTLNFEVSDEYATMNASFLGGFPDTGSVTESFTQETEFAYHQMTAKFGTSISNADGNSATPLKSLSLNIANNVLLDEAFLSGSNEPVAGGLIAGRLQVTGSYSLHFDGTTELDKYKANTKNAAIVALTGEDISGTSTAESITLNLGRLVLTSPPKEINIDGMVILNQEFEVEFDSTDDEIEAVVVNGDTGSNY